MRKLFVLVLTSFFALAAFAKTAPDIIVTDDEEKLEVKILKVTEQQVSYKMMDNLEGPEFVVDLDKITTILYANGDVQNFAEPNAYPVMPIQVAAIPEDRQLIPAENGYMIGDKYLNRAQYEEFLRSNCPIAYDRWKTTNKYWAVGSSFLGVGVTCIVASIVTGVISGVQYAESGAPVDSQGNPVMTQSMENLGTAAIVTGVVGSAFTAAAIPLMIVNGIRRSNTYNLYNQQCAMQEKPVASLNFQVDDAGVGFALHF